MKWFMINNNTLLDEIKNYMNRNTSDVYSNNIYDISLLLWNVFYTYDYEHELIKVLYRNC